MESMKPQGPAALLQENRAVLNDHHVKALYLFGSAVSEHFEYYSMVFIGRAGMAFGKKFSGQCKGKILANCREPR